MRAPRLLVVDQAEGLTAQVRRATAALRPHPDVVACGGLDDVRTLVADGPVDVVIAGPPMMTDAGLDGLRKLRQEFPSTNLLLADRRRSRNLRQTVRTGALDILNLPVDDTVVADAVAQALEIARAAAIEDPVTKSTRRVDGDVVCVMSPSGGAGKTFLSINLAYHLQTRLHRSSCLVDLDLQFGELSTALRLKHKYTISDLLARDDVDGDELSDHLDDYIAAHDTGIHVLPAPSEPADADAVEPADVDRVIGAAQRRFDYVIVDTPAMLSEQAMVAVERADLIFALATLDVPSVRNLRVLASTLEQLKVPPERVKLVLNKVEPDVGIEIGQVTKYFHQGFSMVIPYERQVNRALNMGAPMLAYAPRSAVSRTLSAALAEIFPPEAPPGEELHPGRRRLLRGRRAPALAAPRT